MWNRFDRTGPTEENRTFPFFSSRIERKKFLTALRVLALGSMSKFRNHSRWSMLIVECRRSSFCKTSPLTKDSKERKQTNVDTHVTRTSSLLIIDPKSLSANRTRSITFNKPGTGHLLTWIITRKQFHANDDDSRWLSNCIMEFLTSRLSFSKEYVWDSIDVRLVRQRFVFHNY